MADQIVPLSSKPNQTLSVSLDVDNKVLVLQLRVRYSEIAGYWLLTVLDRSGGLLVDSIPLLTGEYPAANLLQQHAYLAIGSAFLLNASGVSAEWPNDKTLGTDFQLLWSDTPLV